MAAGAAAATERYFMANLHAMYVNPLHQASAAPAQPGGTFAFAAPSGLVGGNQQQHEAEDTARIMAAQLFPGVHMPGLLGGNPGYPDMLHLHAAGMLPPCASGPNTSESGAAVASGERREPSPGGVDPQALAAAAERMALAGQRWREGENSTAAGGKRPRDDGGQQDGQAIPEVASYVDHTGGGVYREQRATLDPRQAEEAASGGAVEPERGEASLSLIDLATQIIEQNRQRDRPGVLQDYQPIKLEDAAEALQRADETVPDVRTTAGTAWANGHPLTQFPRGQDGRLIDKPPSARTSAKTKPDSDSAAKRERRTMDPALSRGDRRTNEKAPAAPIYPDGIRGTSAMIEHAIGQMALSGNARDRSTLQNMWQWAEMLLREDSFKFDHRPFALGDMDRGVFREDIKERRMHMHGRDKWQNSGGKKGSTVCKYTSNPLLLVMFGSILTDRLYVQGRSARSVGFGASMARSRGKVWRRYGTSSTSSSPGNAILETETRR